VHALERQFPSQGFSASEFAIPGFRIFSENNSTEKKYEEEKKNIMEYYKGKDLAEATY
jgi:hypothetical protein